MAVPKKRTGHSAQGKRRSNWKATKPETAKCPNCGATVLAHTVCMACGQYKGKVVSVKAAGYTETPAVKPVKKAAKAKKEEVKVEETVAEVVEEVKAEEAVVEEVKEVKEEAPAEEKTEEQFYKG